MTQQVAGRALSSSERGSRPPPDRWIARAEPGRIPLDTLPALWIRLVAVHRCAGVRRLVDLVHAEVISHHGIDLEPEVHFIGDWSDWEVAA